mmetsp:Transcript_34343/g.61891  ORF Transcript_34343/g.61891 Transcript_34343/m.61891 type:complete len:215 (-) Transcript_34343:1505-2149(-)
MSPSPNAPHACTKSGSVRRPALEGSNLLQTFVRDPPVSKNFRRAASSCLWAAGSMSLSVIFSESPAICFQTILELPWCEQSCSIRQKSGNSAVPLRSGSSTARHAATVVPCLVLIAFCIAGSGDCSANCNVEGDGFDGLRSNPVFPAWNDGVFGWQRTVVSPRMRFLVHIGSMSQIVKSRRPRIGCKALNNLWASCGYSNFLHTSTSSTSVMLS